MSIFIIYPPTPTNRHCLPFQTPSHPSPFPHPQNKQRRSIMNSKATWLATLILILSSIIISTKTAFGQPQKLSAYEILQQYGLPKGLLPEGVTRYELNKETGEFAAYMDGTCSFPIQSYNLRYKQVIRGVISNRRVSNLSGVSVKVFFFWLNIVQVVLDGDELLFSVGIASTSFPVTNFLQSPHCGCGLDCNKLVSTGVQAAAAAS
ncbi:uncharacterized protein LOC110821407 [Carica papaya]|uniref:uncharacterized protein LOC110821407 n=1 Tax=Carica papaya TaxID=3649 RepID=UPI000B8CBAC5|nr:uncharacterized protein LOC110821407 [Carica papaya]